MWLRSHNVDFQLKKSTYLNEKLASIKDGDWVRVFGVLRLQPKVAWKRTNPDELLSSGELIISDIKRVVATPE